MDFVVEPSGGLNGEIILPGDKSISHRAIMCASLASGTSKIKGFLESEDCLATMRSFQELGVDITKEENYLKIEGKGLYGLSKPKGILDVGNSGTSMRIATGILAGQKFDSIITGDESLLKRPMSRITEPLKEMGFSVIAQKGGTPPLKISKVNQVYPINYELPIASAQVKSCLMFAALYASETSVIKESKVTRDHTERMFKKFGIPIEIKKSNFNKTISVSPPTEIRPTNLEICSDFSSAAFFILAAIITPNSHLLIKKVGVNKTRIGFLAALKEMGGHVIIKNLSEGYEPTADIEVKSSKLNGITLDPKLVPNINDEMPALFIAAALAEGTTQIRGVQELRVKESDRLEVMSKSLGLFGVPYIISEDGIDITGLNQSLHDSNTKEPFNEAEIDSFGDHRIAMASAIGALRSRGQCRIKNCENVTTSFPTFLEVADELGLNITTD